MFTKLYNFTILSRLSNRTKERSKAAKGGRQHQKTQSWRSRHCPPIMQAPSWSPRLLLRDLALSDTCGCSSGLYDIGKGSSSYSKLACVPHASCLGCRRATGRIEAVRRGQDILPNSTSMKDMRCCSKHRGYTRTDRQAWHDLRVIDGIPCPNEKGQYTCELWALLIEDIRLGVDHPAAGKV